MAEYKLTSDVPFAITVEAEVDGGEVIADLRPGSVTKGVLRSAQNLGDVASPSAARANLGATSVGSSLFTTASGDAAMTTIGMSHAGVQMAKTTGLGMRAYLGLLSYPVPGVLPDIVSANGATVQIFIGAGGGKITQAWASSTVPIVGGPLVFTVRHGSPFATIGGQPFQIPVGSQTAHVAFDTGSEVLNGNVPLEVVISGGNTAQGLVNMLFDVQPSPLI